MPKSNYTRKEIRDKNGNFDTQFLYKGDVILSTGSQDYERFKTMKRIIDNLMRASAEGRIVVESYISPKLKDSIAATKSNLRKIYK